MPTRLTQTGAEVQDDLYKIEDIDLATEEKAGLMSPEDKTKLDNIDAEIPTKLSDLEDDSTHRTVTDTEKQTWNNKSEFSGRYQDLTGRPFIPTKTGDLVNNSGFITRLVDDLANYYLKSEVYTKAEVAALIASIQGFSVRVVDVLPTASAETMRAIYLVPSAEPQTGNTKDEWITVEDNGAYRWEQIGSTAISLDGYVTDEELTAALQGYVTSAAFATAMAGKQDVIGDLSEIRAGAQAGASAYQKPAAGIPATDLSEAVQESLEKADNPPTEVFWATYGVTTSNEMDVAIAANKILACRYDNRTYIFTRKFATSASYNYYWFSSFSEKSNFYVRLRDDNQSWYAASDLFQEQANRVSSWQSTPDNSHYPSEKLVKDSLDAKAAKVSSPTEGDLAKLDANGNLADSGLTPNMLSLFPDFDNLTPLETIEYDVTASGFWTLFERDNSAGTLASEAAEAIACRITTTGTNLTEPQVVDLVAFLPGRVNEQFTVLVNPKTPNITAPDRYGIYQMQEMYPKAIGSGYGWGVRINAQASASVTRHIKVEVFKTAKTVTFSTSKVDTYNSGYHFAVGSRALNALRTLNNLFLDINGSSTSAGYINGYFNSFILGTPAVAGEALATYNICFFSTDNKLYKISTTNVPIFADAGTHLVGNNFSANQTVGYAYLRQKASCTIASSSATYGTFTKGEEIYLRCHISNGVLYSDGILTNAVAPGYTWISVGKADSAAQLALDTVGKQFFTLDANGKLTHINGREIASGGGGGSSSPVLKISVPSVNSEFTGIGYCLTNRYVMSRRVEFTVPGQTITNITISNINDSEDYLEASQDADTGIWYITVSERDSTYFIEIDLDETGDTRHPVTGLLVCQHYSN